MAREAAAVKDEAPAEEQAPRMDNAAHIATAPLDGPPTLAERRRNEERVAKEKEELHDEYKAAIAKLDLSKSKYKFILYRTFPLSHKGVKTGAPQGMLIAAYDEPFEVEDVMENHGGQDYYVTINGPDPDNPSKVNWKKRVKLAPIMAPPKTISTAGGTMLLEDAPATSVNGKDDGAMHTLLGIIKDEFAKKNEAPRQTGPDPMVAMQLEQARQAHELRLKQMDLDTARAAADATVEAARLKAESEKVKAEADARVKEMEIRSKAEEAARDRAHKSELERIKADADARVETAKQRAEDQKALRDLMDSNNKSNESRFEKLVDKLSSNKPVSVFKEVGDAMEALKKMGMIPNGEKEEEESPTVKLLQSSMPEFFKLANKAVEQIINNGGKVKEAPKQIAQPDVVAAAEIPNEAKDVTPGVEQKPAETKPAEPEAPKEPDLPFEWPVEGDDVMKLSSKMGLNLGIAVEAKWNADRVYSDMVAKFPEDFQKQLVAWGLDMVFSGIAQHAPEDSAIRSIGGRRVVRTVFKVLEKKFGK